MLAIWQWEPRSIPQLFSPLPALLIELARCVKTYTHGENAILGHLGEGRSRTVWDSASFQLLVPPFFLRTLLIGKQSAPNSKELDWRTLASWLCPRRHQLAGSHHSVGVVMAEKVSPTQLV